jgi:1-acyl-sn-glycerol-3-phosphate acyltransferase
MAEELASIHLELEKISQVKPSAKLARNPIIQRVHGRVMRAKQTCKLTEEEAEKLEKSVASLRLDTAPSAGLLGTVSAVLRFGVSVSVLLLGSTFLLLLMPLRWAHPLLRRLGIKNDSLPMDLLQRLFSRSLVTAAGIKVHVQGADAMKGPTLLMYSHGSNLDPMCIAASSPVVCKWVGKKELFLIPIFGWMMLGCGTQPISRSNRTKAVKTLASMRQQFETWGRSLAIAPEGTRSKSGLLLPFKSGPFYLWEDTNLSVTPAILFGAYELWAPKQFFTSTGQVVLRFCNHISPPANDSKAAARSPASVGKEDTKEEKDRKQTRRETMKKKVFSAMLHEATGVAPNDAAAGDSASHSKHSGLLADSAGQPLSAMRPMEQLAFAAEYTLLLCGLWGVWTVLSALYNVLFAGLSGTEVAGYFFLLTVVVDSIIFVQY